MTGFASAQSEYQNKRINIDLRSVNHRFLDIQFKMPEELRHLESSLRDIIAQHAQRGKIECRIQIQNNENSTTELNINEKLFTELAELNDKWRKKYSKLGKLSIADILKFPGVLQSQSEDNEALSQHIQNALQTVAQDFAQARQREGKKLQAHILERLDAMSGIVEALSELFPHLLQAYLDKSRARLAEAIEEIDENRLKQEFALYMQKADVDEEFSRLNGHIAEVRRIVTEQKGSIGKRLDFLMQELNREANTLGSKAIATESTQASVELKVLIEQMREQVQNIE